MSKLLVVLCIAFIAMTVASACSPPGFFCQTDDDCCFTKLFRCLEIVGRCVKRNVTVASTTALPTNSINL
uniref:Knottin-like protein n=1 Tax=Lysiphlebus testaceipes TaxID=77504 RepID=Q2MJU0_LYSTE|nr:knottin-like protein [Lysiphlebus testaceipes]